MKNTVVTFRKAKQENIKQTMITAYDYSFAKLFDESGVNSILDAHAYSSNISLFGGSPRSDLRPTFTYTVQDHIKNPTKKAPGKGGHHLALCYPSTHPSSRLSEAS